jgi:hypothetical protein
LFFLYFYSLFFCNQIAVPIVFSILQCTLLTLTYETPKFLLQKKRPRAAARGLYEFDYLFHHEKISFYLALKWFRRETDKEVIQAEIHEMEADFHNIQTNSTEVITTPPIY